MSGARGEKKAGRVCSSIEPVPGIVASKIDEPNFGIEGVSGKCKGGGGIEKGSNGGEFTGLSVFGGAVFWAIVT